MDIQEEKRLLLEERERFKKEMDKYKVIKNHYRNFIIISCIFAITTILKFYSLWYISIAFLLIAVVLWRMKKKYDWEYKKHEFVYMCTFIADDCLDQGVNVNIQEQVDNYIEDLEKKIK